MFLLETVVELLGDLFHVERRTHPARNVNDGQVVFLVQRKDKLLQLLDQRLARLVPVINMLARPIGLARFALDPLPILRAPVGRGVHDEVFTDGLGNGFFDLLAGGMVRECVVCIGGVLVNNHAAFVGYSFENERLACDCNFCVLAAVVPAKLLNE